MFDPPPDTVVERIRRSSTVARIYPDAALTTNPPRPALTPELPTLTRGQLRAANGSVISLDHGRSSGAVDVWTMLIGPPAPHLLLTFHQLPPPRRICNFRAASARCVPAQVALICSTSFRGRTLKIHPPRYDPAPRNSPVCVAPLSGRRRISRVKSAQPPETPEVMNNTSSTGSGGIPAPFQARHTPCNVVAVCRALRRDGSACQTLTQLRADRMGSQRRHTRTWPAIAGQTKSQINHIVRIPNELGETTEAVTILPCVVRQARDICLTPSGEKAAHSQARYGSLTCDKAILSSSGEFEITRKSMSALVCDVRHRNAPCMTNHGHPFEFKGFLATRQGPW